MTTKKLECLYCGAKDYLSTNSKGEVHCYRCCKEDNDRTGLQCEPIPYTFRGNSLENTS